jgi:hypothetical protein
MRKKYRILTPSQVHLKRPHGDFLDPDVDYSHIPDITVYEPEPETVHTGLIDASGNEIVYDTEPMGRIGFVFPCMEQETDDEE